jgi:hypothetical protein
MKRKERNFELFAMAVVLPNISVVLEQAEYI